MPSTVRWKFFSYDMIACVECVIYPLQATPGKQLWDPSHLCSWPHIRTQRITGRVLRICLQPIGMSTVAILTGQSWGVLSNPDSSQPVPGSEIVGSAELRKHEHENNFHLCVIPTVLEHGTGYIRRQSSLTTSATRDVMMRRRKALPAPAVRVTS